MFKLLALVAIGVSLQLNVQKQIYIYLNGGRKLFTSDISELHTQCVLISLLECMWQCV